MKLVHIKEKYLRDFFDASVILKGVDSIIEIVGGFVLLFVSTARLDAVANFFLQAELVEDPHDAIANFLNNTFHTLAGPEKIFGAIYLLVHGAIKIVLVTELLRNRYWAYPAAIIIFIIFGIYQTYYLFISYSFWLLALTVLDVIVIILTWHEYRYRLRHHSFAK